jgi:long-subunit fatty acid transport protein
VNDWLSIGGGVSLNYGVIDFKLKLLRLANQIDPSALRGRLSSLAPGLRAIVGERLIQEGAGKVPPQLAPLVGSLPPAAQRRLRDKALSELSVRARTALEPALGRIAGVSDLLSPGPDGEVEIDGADDIAFSWNLGVLIEPNERTRFGITYRSKVDFEFAGDFKLDDIPPLYRALGIREGDIDMDVPIPQMVRASVFHQLTDTVAVMGDVGWEDWSEMDFTPLSGPAGRTIEIPRGWHDTWHFGLGVEWRAAPAWLLQTGVAFDTSPVRDRHHNLPDMPADRQWRFSAGLVYDWSESVKVGLNYTFVDFGDNPINASTAFGRLERDYEEFYGHVVALSVEF